MSSSVSHDFKTPQMSLGKAQIWPKFENYQKLTNVGFCDNFFDRSLVLILKYTVCEFYGCTIFFKGNKDILNLKKTIEFFFFKFKISSYP